MQSCLAVCSKIRNTAYAQLITYVNKKDRYTFCHNYWYVLSSLFNTMKNLLTHDAVLININVNFTYIETLFWLIIRHYL